MPDQPQLEPKRGFIAELSRRHVWRAAVLYVGAVWALSQGIAQLGPLFHAPDWALRWFVIACVIGFPFWVAFAWFFEFTPEGVQRESAIADRDASYHRATGRKLDYWIIGVLAVAVVLLATNTFVLRRDATSVAERHSANAIAATLAKVPQKSIAVLPLANTSGDERQRYFSDGLSEELISALAQVAGLKVTGSASSFQFRDSKDSPAAIGAALGVANLLEGSVRHQGDVVRISLQLIHAADGSAVWSQHYDRPYKDLFALQDDITKAVAGALAARFNADAQTQSDRPPSGNLQAYTAYLKVRQMQRAAQTAATFQKMIDQLDIAVRLDPHYAAAQAGLAILWIGKSTFGGPDRQQDFAKARTAANTALALDPNLASVHNALGSVDFFLDHDWSKAESELRRAVALAPQYGSYAYNLGILLTTLGRNDEALPLVRTALDQDPLNASYYTQYAFTLVMLGRLDEATQVAHRLASTLPKFAPEVHGMLSQIAILRGDASTALAEARQSPKAYDAREANVALALQIGPDRKAADAALQALIAKPASDQLYGTVANAYALRNDPDAMFKWLDRSGANQEGLATALLTDPYLVPYYHDPRFVKLLHRFNLPVPGAAPASAASRL